MVFTFLECTIALERKLFDTAAAAQVQKVCSPRILWRAWFVLAAMGFLKISLQMNCFRLRDGAKGDYDNVALFLIK